jgi:hypothetical protein
MRHWALRRAMLSEARADEWAILLKAVPRRVATGANSAESDDCTSREAFR